MSVGLVLEGGGMRGIYTAGALEILLEHNIEFPYIAAVSAGACNATTFIAKQKKRNYTVLTKYVNDKRYLSVHNLFHKKSMFDFDFVLDEIGRELHPLDFEQFFASKTRFYTGATNIVTAKPVYFDKDHYKENFDCLRASCSQPFVSPVIKYQGMELLDGGLADPIPIEKSIQDGNQKNVIILTRHNGYQKKKEFPASLSKAMYGRYPHLIELLNTREIMYNKKLEYCNALERQGQAIIIRPKQKLMVNRCEKDKQKLHKAYLEGRRDMKKKLEQVIEWTSQV